MVYGAAYQRRGHIYFNTMFVLKFNLVKLTHMLKTNTKPNSLFFKACILFSLLAIAVIATLLIGQKAQAHGTNHHFGDRIKLSALSRYHVGPFNSGASEVVAYDPATQRAFVTNAHKNSVDAVSLAKPESPLFDFSIDFAKHGKVNSLAVMNGILAIAVEAKDPQQAGVIALFDTDGKPIHSFSAGAMPDMVTFSPNGKFILSANEGEAVSNLSIDPEGSVTLIRLNSESIESSTVTQIGFEQFTHANIDPLINISPNAKTVAQDLEPEYITVSGDSKTAWLSLQENNALAEISLEHKRVKKLYPLGYKDHSKRINGLDLSDTDKKINIRPWPIKGMYQPDSIASYDVNGDTFIVTANEGDARNQEVSRVAKLANASEFNESLGRLNVLAHKAEKKGELISFGGRSFSIWNQDGVQVFDSASQFEQITARDYPKLFNQGDSRSDDSGPEPEALTIGKVGNAMYAFIGLERTGGVMVYNISEPENAFFVDYYNNISAKLETSDPEAGDMAPESLVFVNSIDSPSGQPFLISSNEVSGTLSLYKIDHAAHKDRK